MSEVIISFLNNVTVILISLILLSNFFVFRVCTETAAGPAIATAKNKKKTIPQQ